MALPTYESIDSPAALMAAEQHRVHTQKQVLPSRVDWEAKWVDDEDELFVAFRVLSDGTTTKFDHPIINQP